MNLTVKEAFHNPQLFRDLILKHVHIAADRKQFAAKAFICVSFTRFCPVGCPFCFFSSAPALKEKSISDAFTEEGLERFIQFANDCNLGYLLVSGGGEPFMEKNCVLKVVEEVISDKIVLVTSANWAKSKAAAATYVKQIYEAFKKRKTPTNLVVRVSIDEEHAKVGLEPVYHLIHLFEELYLNESHFKLQFHTLFDDPCIDKLLGQLSGKIVASQDHKRKSDAETILKVNPAEKVIQLASGLSIKVGYAKRFYSNIKIDLNDPTAIERNLATFEWDITESEENNSSVVTNMDGKKGLDFWVNFNGNVTTWGNQVPDNIFNLYEDSYVKVVNATFEDPLSLSYLEKGTPYRDRIVNEVNPKAVIRARATNIRDYTGAIICEEEKTRLYLSLRIIQDYIKEGRITPSELTSWPLEIQQLLSLKKEELIQLYRESGYSIIDQYMKREFNQSEWLDLFELIKLSHYDISATKIKEAIEYYNKRVAKEFVTRIEDIVHKPRGYFHEERLIAIKASVAERYLKDKVLVHA